jgi:hypothetical protein
VPGWEDRIVEALGARGIAAYRDLRDPTALLEFAAAVGDVVHHRSGNASGFTDLADGNGGVWPSKFLHTDGAGQTEPPDLVVLHCVQPAPDGGLSLLADAHRLCTTLAKDYRQAFNAIRDPSIACIRSGPELYRGPFLTELGPSRYHFRFRADNEEISRKLAVHLNTIVYAAGTVTERLELTAGAGYVVRNERWLHGRTSMTGHRQALRLLINVSPETRLGGRLPAPGFPLD